MCSISLYAINAHLLMFCLFKNTYWPCHKSIKLLAFCSKLTVLPLLKYIVVLSALPIVFRTGQHKYMMTSPRSFHHLYFE